MYLISIEGNIGCGKTSLLNEIDSRVTASNLKIRVEFEPVEEWTKDFKGVSGRGSKNMLGEFYNDKDRNAMSFQMFVLYTRMKQYRRIAEDNINTVTVIERSMDTDMNVFAMMNLSHDDCAWHSYVTWYNEAQKTIAFPCANVYLKCSASKCLERIGVRNRDAEIGVTLEYLQDVEKIHEQWLLDSSDVLVVDTNADGDDVIKRTADAVFEKIRTMCPIIGAGEA
jgi:deoxyadenosine/deoxycytidine kinase